MEFEKNKRSKRQSSTISLFSQTEQQVREQPGQMLPPAWREETISCDRDEKELEERMDKFYTLLGRIKAMRGLWRQGSENKRVKPVLQPVWQPTFSLEDFNAVARDGREREHVGKERGELMEISEKWENRREEKKKGEEIQKEPQKRNEEIECYKVKNYDLDLNLSL